MNKSLVICKQKQTKLKVFVFSLFHIYGQYCYFQLLKYSHVDVCTIHRMGYIALQTYKLTLFSLQINAYTLQINGYRDSEGLEIICFIS